MRTIFSRELKLIRETEIRADESLKKAKADAGVLIERAEEEALRMTEKAEEEAESVYRSLVEKGAQEAKEKYDAAIEEAVRQQALIARRAEPNIEKGAAIAAERIVKVNVGS